jgi:hypothetical protein
MGPGTETAAQDEAAGEQQVRLLLAAIRQGEPLYVTLGIAPEAEPHVRAALRWVDELPPRTVTDPSTADGWTARKFIRNLAAVSWPQLSADTAADRGAGVFSQLSVHDLRRVLTEDRGGETPWLVLQEAVVLASQGHSLRFVTRRLGLAGTAAPVLRELWRFAGMTQALADRRVDQVRYVVVTEFAELVGRDGPAPADLTRRCVEACGVSAPTARALANQALTDLRAELADEQAGL